jgi:hypothetical protein
MTRGLLSTKESRVSISAVEPSHNVDHELPTEAANPTRSPGDARMIE